MISINNFSGKSTSPRTIYLRYSTNLGEVEKLPTKMNLNGGDMPVFNPATGELCGHYLETTQKEYQLAVDKAISASANLRTLPLIDTAEFFTKVIAEIENHRTALQALLITYGGKTITEADVEINEAIKVLELNATVAFQPNGESFPGLTPDTILTTHRVPLTDVSGQLGVSNFVLSITLKHLCPSLMAQTSQVVKAAETGGIPVLDYFKEEIWDKVALNIGRPDLKDSFQLLIGSASVGQYLVNDDRIGVLAITGSSKTFESINCEFGFKKRIIGEGQGNNIVYVDKSGTDRFFSYMTQALWGMGGLRCTTIHQLFYPESNKEEFYNQLKKESFEVFGGLTNPSTVMCSPVSEKAKNDLKSYVNYYGNQTNVTVETFPMTGLPPEYQSGYFYPLTFLIHNTLSTMPKLGPFGPVTNVFFYDHDQPNFFNTQFLPYLMGQDYALANAIFSDCQSKIDQFSMASKAGVHGINMPPNGNPVGGQGFGPGTLKSGQNGFGYAAGYRSHEAYTRKVFTRRFKSPIAPSPLSRSFSNVAYKFLQYMPK